MPEKNKPKLLLHICCIGCGAYVSRVLTEENFDVVLFFYNPNIFPESEYVRRLETTKKIADKFDLEVIEGEYNHKRWLEKIRGFEKEKERGKRCRICYYDRLEKAAEYASKNNFDYFSSTLTISPHKDARLILAFGEELSGKLSIKFLARDFKKNDGFKKSVSLSKELNLYRQNYCGCEFSRRQICEMCDKNTFD